MTAASASMWLRVWNSRWLTWVVVLLYLGWLGGGAWLSFARHKDPRSTTSIRQVIVEGEKEHVDVEGEVLRSELLYNIKDPYFVGGATLVCEQDSDRPRALELILRFRNVTEADSLLIVDAEGKELAIVSPLVQDLTIVHLRLPPGRSRLALRLTSPNARISLPHARVRDRAEDEVPSRVEHRSDFILPSGGVALILGGGWFPTLQAHFEDVDPAIPMTEIAYVGILVPTPGEYELTLPFDAADDVYPQPEFHLDGVMLTPTVDKGRDGPVYRLRARVKKLSLLRIQSPIPVTSKFQREARILMPRMDARPISYRFWAKRASLRKVD